MDHDRYANLLGQLIGNLQALETAMRVVLCDAHGEAPEKPTAAHTGLKETHLTNFYSLGEVIDAFNALLSKEEAPALTVDRSSIVSLRDALAHGRIITTAQAFPVTLYKFGRPKKGIAPIEAVWTLSEDFLVEKARTAWEETNKVIALARTREYKSLAGIHQGKLAGA